MDTIALALLFALVTKFVIRAWKPRGRLAAVDRWALLSSFAVAIAPFTTAALLINWVRVPAGLWLAAVALLTVGTAGAVLRWPELPWLAGPNLLGRSVSAGATLVLVGCTLLISAPWL